MRMRAAEPAVTPLVGANEEDRMMAQSLKRGDTAAFEALYSRLKLPLFRFALGMCGSHEAAEEALQETFIRFIRKPEGYDSAKGSLDGYLFGMARHVVFRMMERRKPEVDWDENQDFSIEGTGETPLLVSLEKAERVEAVRSAVLGLPVHYREVVVLCDLEEMNYEDAARVLECPVGTVRSRLNRARAQLRVRLEMYQ